MPVKQIQTHECKQETVQQGDRDQNDETYVRHGQLLVESDVHLVSDCYAEREHSNKHSNLENTKQTIPTYYLLEGQKQTRVVIYNAQIQMLYHELQNDPAFLTLHA